MLERSIVFLLIICITQCLKCQASQVAGFYKLSWSTSSSIPSGINLSVCFSGWISISDVLKNCANIRSGLSGKKFLSFGGGQNNGRWSSLALSNLDNGIKNRQLAGWDGIVYDIEEGDSGLISAFASSFANAKANGLFVLVTVSHSQPYGIPDAASLMKSFFSNSNIDYISPQLYTTGSESGNDFTALGTAWNMYASARAKIVPSVVQGLRDFPSALKHFSQYEVTLAGFIQWSQNGDGSSGSSDSSGSSGCHPNYYNQCTSNNQCCSNNCNNNNGAWALGVCQPISGSPGCHPNYYNQCTSNNQCCSNSCNNNNGAWALGVCQPNKIKRIFKKFSSILGKN